MDQFEIREFRPLRLTLDKIGPFQSRIEEIDFTNENNEPCNLYLLLSQNGRGKTTVLEVMAKLMEMIAYDSPLEMAKQEGRSELAPFDFEAFDSLPGTARLDVRMAYRVREVEHIVVFSIWAGSHINDFKSWYSDSLKKVGAEKWDGIAFFRRDDGGWKSMKSYSDFVPLTNAVVRSAGKEDDDWAEYVKTSLRRPIRPNADRFPVAANKLPTLLYFSAYRNIVPVSPTEERSIVSPKGWSYRPSRIFGGNTGKWHDSLDNLLVWLKWLDNGRFDEVVKLVNEHVFGDGAKSLKGIRRDPPEAEVVSEGNIHRLDALSSGEKSLVQLFMRIGAHRTRNTILLIDEPEVHLHENWQYRLFYQLKKLAQDSFPGLTIIVATHSQEMMKAMALELDEPNLIKGGYLFETPEEEARAERISQEAEREYANV